MQQHYISTLSYQLMRPSGCLNLGITLVMKFGIDSGFLQPKRESAKSLLEVRFFRQPARGRYEGRGWAVVASGEIKQKISTLMKSILSLRWHPKGNLQMILLVMAA